MNKKLNNMFLTDIIETFESFLDEKGIVIPNEDRDRDCPDCGSNIYGMDFGSLMYDIREVCANYGVEVADAWE